jgi:hypothetical protein
MQLSRFYFFLTIAGFVLPTAVKLLLVVPIQLLLRSRERHQIGFMDWLRGPGALTLLLVYFIVRALP